MKKEKLLLLDKVVEKDLGLKDSILLMNWFNSDYHWKITIDEYQEITKHITEFSNAISDILINNDILQFDASNRAKMKVVRPLVGIVSYILIDRLIRVLNLTKHIQITHIAVPNIQNAKSFFLHKRELHAFARDDWMLNQYIVNKLLNTINIVDIVIPNSMQNNELSFEDWTYYDGFVKKTKIDVSLKSSLSNFLIKTKRIINPWKYRIESFRLIEDKILSDLLGYHKPHMIREGFADRKNGIIDFNYMFSPYIYFSESDLNLDKRKCLINALDKNFLFHLGKILKKIGFTENKFEHHITNFTQLFFMLYPISGLEASAKLYKSAYTLVKRYKSKVYVTMCPSTDEYHYYVNAAATQQNFTIFGVQHSAWGGYLTNSPLIAEEDINGTDYYITSGWTHPEPHLPSWKVKAIPLSSPAYTEIGKTFSINQNNNKNVLLSLGQIYLYPVIYSGIYYIDTRKEWSDFLKNLINLLIEKKIYVLIKSYSSISADLTSDLFNEWEKLFGNKIKIIQDYRKGKAMEYFKNVSATIWDIPSGGFVESLLSGTPAFAIASTGLMRFQPESKEYINALKEYGLLNETVDVMVNNIESAVTHADWWKNGDRKKAIDNFLNKFIHTNLNWKQEWQDFFFKLLSEEEI